MSLDELAAAQQKSGLKVIRIASNFKKDPVSRKNLEYLQLRLKNLDENWANFDATDSEIRENFEKSLEHPYFTQGYYDKVRGVYEKIRQEIISMWKMLEAKAVQNPAPQAETNPQNPKTAEATVSNADDKIEATQDQEHDSQANLTILLRRQRVIIGSLRRTLASLSTAEQTRSSQFYELKMSSIQRYWDQVETLHHDIMVAGEFNPTGYNIEDYLDLEQAVQTTLIQLTESLHLILQPPASSNTADKSAMQQPISNTSSLMSLPKITLPTFDGDYLKWSQFRDLFTEVVHNQPISNCQKMWYLKTTLEGEAEKLIRHMTVSDANYGPAWKIVKDRYENSRLLASAFLNKLLSQSAQAAESASSIRSLHDTTQECLLALESLGIPTTQWDPLLVHMLVKKLDKTTHGLYEQSLKEPKKLQSIAEFLAFLEARFQALQALGTNNKGRAMEDHSRRSTALKSLATTKASKGQCPFCTDQHPLFGCPKFLQLTISKRLNWVKGAKLCVNCLKQGHNSASCPSRTCMKCSKKHNTLLHLEDRPSRPKTTPQSTTTNHEGSTASTSSKAGDSGDQSVSLTTQSRSTRGYVMLSTVVVELQGNKGSLTCRGILDSGSQLNFITDRVAKKLQLTQTPDIMNIEGIGKRTQQAQRRVNLLIRSRINDFNIRMEAHVLPQIISPQPTKFIDTSSWAIPHNITLADPEFGKPADIDLLIGADVYFYILSVGQVKLGQTLPVLQNTVFGWTVAGKVQESNQGEAVCGVSSETEGLDQQVERFWRLEEAEQYNTQMTATERRCETYFNETTRRNPENGHYIVKLPFLEDPQKLGESKDIAYRRFLALEQKLAKQEDLRKQYVDFMAEYTKLSHMEEINFNEVQKPYYFLPHHCVIKPDSTTTKLRVVFDASAKTSSNFSLNDLLAAGPKVQEDLFSILLRFRLPRFVITADIEKMFRQIEMDEDDRKYQLVWWREDRAQKLKCFQLSTVTYGTSSAPYLATKCLQRLAKENADKYPLGAEVLQRDFYVDDVMTGSDSLAVALETQKQLQLVLTSGGFKLRKWCSNHPQLLKNIPESDKELQLDFSDKVEEHVKTVGLTWLPKTDLFCIKTSWPEGRRITKRTAYSDVAHLFDPLGIMGPVVIVAKMFLQKLWTIKLDWDAALPQDLHTTWLKFREGLKELNNINFPRHIFAQRVPASVQVHVFTDASEKAYGAAVYIRSTNKDNIVAVRLLCAKSRVAPVKPSTTLPRLELCAAKLGAELGNRVKKDLKLNDASFYFWSDSEIVLAWINSTSSSFHTFVANRVSVIQQLTIPLQWRHVKSKENPADILSRGIAPERLGQCNMWFYGPTFLHGSQSLWPRPYKAETRTALPVGTENKGELLSSINHRNSFRRLQRVVVYILRCLKNIKYIKQIRKGKDWPLCTNRSITAHELHEAESIIVRAMQEEEFKWDIAHIKQHEEANKNSPLNSLTPYLDQQGILRVGGRLEAATIPYDAKHPILLPYSHPFTRLLLQDIHKENCHAGPQTMLAISRQRFWPIKGKTLARSIVQSCIRCTRAKPKLLSQIMGNLPADRVQPARPFLNSGVDFCGPIWTHFKIRGKHPQKTYISVFCCFATKAIHMELVSDLSTKGFLGALKRFTARRGHCKNIYCDNATNFVGANNELHELKQSILSTEAQTKIQAAGTPKGTDFHFIPPRAPHFGGLWEAAVKSAKHLLQRTLEGASLTYEELETAVVEVEAILNSRPITPMSSDPNDLTALTPGHFLIGEPLTSTADPDATPSTKGLLTRWKLVSHVKEDFWRRWSNEYLNHLQHRYKWKQQCQNVEPGTMVIIKEDNRPPLRWPMGRIVKTIRGDDGIVRVADVRTANGTIRRAIHRLAPLPVQLDDDSINEEGTPVTNKPSDPSANQQPKATSTNKLSKRASSPEAIPTSRDRGASTSVITSSRMETPPKRNRLTLGSAIISLLLTCLIVPAAKGSSIEVTPFNSESGIYFEGLGEVKIFSNEWSLVAYYNMEPYWQEFKAFQAHIRSMTTVCEQMVEKNECSKIVQYFLHLSEDLAQTNQLLQPHALGSRAKRGAINFIGNMANALFGVLDSEYAEEMSKTIDGLRSNEIHLSTLIKNQTSIIDATINVMKRDQEATARHFKELEVQITQLTAHVTNIDKVIYQERISQLFTLVAMQVMLAGSNFQRAQGSILGVLIDTHHGKLNPQLISPDQLRSELNMIRNHLPPSLQLPAEQGEVLKLYNLMRVEGSITTKHIVFRVTLPLVASENFEMFRVIPVPTLVNETFVAIRPSTPYIVINLHRDQYYPLSEEELHFCIIIAQGRHLCKQRHPIYHKGSSSNSCEVQLLNNMSNSTSCAVTRVEDKPYWIQLHNPNHWIYVLREKTVINAVCGNNHSQRLMSGAGILRIESNCVIRQPLINIQGHHVFPSTMKMSFVPTTNLTELVPPERLAPIIRAPIPHTHPYQSEVNELEAIQKQLLQVNSDLPEQIQPHDVHQFSVGYIGLLIACTAVGLFIWNYRLKQCMKLNKPKPMPRRHAAAAETSNSNVTQLASKFNFDVDCNV